MQTRILTYGSIDYQLALLLRYKILRHPLGLMYSAKDLEQNSDDIYIGTFRDNFLAGCLILSPTANHEIKMRQVAVDTAFQGKGIGTEMLQFSENLAPDKGYTTMYCHARETAVPFYLKNGYQIKGDCFIEVGINHRFMFKALL